MAQQRDDAIPGALSLEVKCAYCDSWSPEDRWDETEIGSGCDTRPAMACPECGEAYDTAGRSWTNLPERPCRRPRAVQTTGLHGPVDDDQDDAYLDV